MKIQVSKLRPNPFRKIDSYPIDKTKVDTLVESIKETDFWDNILGRKKGEFYEIAYGHHRLEAIKKLEIEEVDIPVRELSDAKMIKIMANENLEQWRSSPAVVNETVSTVKQFLDGELKKCKDYRELNVAKNSNVELFTSNKQFMQCKKQGVGRTIILKFLGSPWKENMIEKALKLIDENKTSKKLREACEVFDNQTQADQFWKKAQTDKLKQKMFDKNFDVVSYAKETKENQKLHFTDDKATVKKDAKSKSEANSDPKVKDDDLQDLVDEIKDFYKVVNSFRGSCSSINAMFRNNKNTDLKLGEMSSMSQKNAFRNMMDSLLETLKNFGWTLDDILKPAEAENDDDNKVIDIPVQKAK